jgi:hypothetical protein
MGSNPLPVMGTRMRLPQIGMHATRHTHILRAPRASSAQFRTQNTMGSHEAYINKSEIYVRLNRTSELPRPRTTRGPIPETPKHKAPAAGSSPLKGTSKVPTPTSQKQRRRRAAGQSEGFNSRIKALRKPLFCKTLLFLIMPWQFELYG